MNSYRANIWKLYLYWFCHNLIFAYVIERLFGLERGLNVQEMVYLEMLYSGFTILLEVPTGALADRWSRKNVMFLSAIFIFFEFFILIFAFNFWMFALSALSASIGGALASGTSNALFYDSLKAEGQEAEFEKVLGRNTFFQVLAGGCAALGGSYIATHLDLTSTYSLSLIGVTCAILVTLFLQEPPLTQHKEEKEEQSSYWQHINIAFQFLKNHFDIRFVLLYSVAIGSTVVYVDEYWQIYFNEVGIPVGFFGVYSLLYLLMEGVAGLSVGWLKQRFSIPSMLAFLILGLATAILTASLLKSWYGILPLLVVILLFGIAQPLVYGYLHHQTESKHRATVESFQSLAVQSFSLAVGFVFGSVSTYFSIFEGFFFLGLVLAIYGCYFVSGVVHIKKV